MNLVLVRHGETEWNKLGKFQGHLDVGLNSRGVAQAQETAREVLGWKHSVVFSSPLLRTMQVAEEISRLSGKPVVPVAGFMELSLGDLEGVTGEEMRAGWPEVYAGWNANPASVSMPGGESLTDLQERAWNSLLELERARPREETLVVVSHNFTIRSMICKVLGIPLTNFHRMSLSLGSICIVESDQRGRRLMHYNSVCHLSSDNR